MSIYKNLQKVRQEITGINIPVPRIMAVSKDWSIEQIDEALHGGCRIFGENRVGDACKKWHGRKDGVELYFIGQLQSNKVSSAVTCFDVIATVDRKKIADSIASESVRQSKKIKIMIQVNIGNESQKHGVPIEDLRPLFIHCQEAGLDIVGFFAIPPLNKNPLPFFIKMRLLAREFAINSIEIPISIGMSNDYLLAAECGSSLLRLGRRLTDDRNYE